MSALVDLHLHTTASDGRLSPTELVHLCLVHTSDAPDEENSVDTDRPHTH